MSRNLPGVTLVNLANLAEFALALYGGSQSKISITNSNDAQAQHNQTAPIFELRKSTKQKGFYTLRTPLGNDGIRFSRESRSPGLISIQDNLDYIYKILQENFGLSPNITQQDIVSGNALAQIRSSKIPSLTAGCIESDTITDPEKIKENFLMAMAFLAQGSNDTCTSYITAISGCQDASQNEVKSMTIHIEKENFCYEACDKHYTMVLPAMLPALQQALSILCIQSGLELSFFEEIANLNLNESSLRNAASLISNNDPLDLSPSICGYSNISVDERGKILLGNKKVEAQEGKISLRDKITITRILTAKLSQDGCDKVLEGRKPGKILLQVINGTISEYDLASVQDKIEAVAKEKREKIEQQQQEQQEQQARSEAESNSEMTQCIKLHQAIHEDEVDPHKSAAIEEQIKNHPNFQLYGNLKRISNTKAETLNGILYKMLFQKEIDAGQNSRQILMGLQGKLFGEEGVGNKEGQSAESPRETKHALKDILKSPFSRRKNPQKKSSYDSEAPSQNPSQPSAINISHQLQVTSASPKQVKALMETFFEQYHKEIKVQIGEVKMYYDNSGALLLERKEKNIKMSNVFGETSVILHDKSRVKSKIVNDGKDSDLLKIVNDAIKALPQDKVEGIFPETKERQI